MLMGIQWAGIQFPWSSAKVLVPLILGFLGLAGFLFYEAWVPQYPLVSCSEWTSKGINLLSSGSYIFVRQSHCLERIRTEFFQRHSPINIGL
jgi:hypothetical protein